MNCKALILLVAVLIAGLSSCKKNDTVPVIETTYVNVINASTDTLNFYENGSRQNNTSNLYPFGSLGYIFVNVGQQNFQFKKAGSPNALVSVAYTLDTATPYTLFTAGETPDKVFITRDTLITDTAARIRYVNASPIAGTIDVVLGNSFNYKARPFKSITGFVHVSSGKSTLTIYQTGNAIPLASGTITLAAGASYTLFTKGVLNGTGNNAFGVRTIITH